MKKETYLSIRGQDMAESRDVDTLIDYRLIERQRPLTGLLVDWLIDWRRTADWLTGRLGDPKDVDSLIERQRPPMVGVAFHQTLNTMH
jgi:hypothetical protein